MLEGVISVGRFIALAAWGRLVVQRGPLQAALILYKKKVLEVDSASIEVQECWTERCVIFLLPLGDRNVDDALLYTYRRRGA